MGKLYVSEYADIRASAPYEPETATQVVSYSTATASNAFNANTHFIRVHTDAICSIAIGADPTATTNHKRMVAGQTEYFYVQPGHKISAVSNT